MKGKTCCVTGHRDLPQNEINKIKAALEHEIDAAVTDGFTCFMSGFADGVDQYLSLIHICCDGHSVQYAAERPAYHHKDRRSICFCPGKRWTGTIWRISPINNERPLSSVRMGNPSTTVSCRNHKMCIRDRTAAWYAICVCSHTTISLPETRPG